MRLVIAPVLLCILFAPFAMSAAEPLRALLVAGGCCHDYAKQHEILSQGIQARANVQVDVIWTDDKSTNPPLPLYDNADWAKGYDIIIHDECAAGNTSKEVLSRILDAHKTIPSVQLHCAMHSFRTGEARWFKHLGLQSNSHNWQKPISIKFVDPDHPITKGLADWTTINEELYNNVNLFDAHPLAMGTQDQKASDGAIKPQQYVVAWTNEKVGARSFSTTIGHNNETVADARYLDLVTRGMLWAMDKLNADYLGKPFTGKNTVTFVKAKPEEKKPAVPAPAITLGAPPKDATLVTVTASSEESGKQNYAWKAVDGSADTRWCAGDASKPQWLQLEFEKAQEISGIKIVWESNRAYQYKVEASDDGQGNVSWATLVDQTKNTKDGVNEDLVSAGNTKKVKGGYVAKKIKITCTGSNGGWASIREVTLKGEDIKSIYPKLDASQQAHAADGKKKKKAERDPNDPYKDEGNIKPEIVKLTPEEEAEILKDVKVPEGFDVTLFSNPKAANYPVYVSAAPNGDLYVSSDGNGSLGRNPHRGRIVRLRDTDGDGRADQVTEFVKDVDSPRGLVWDHDRLYLIHPPDISVYIDKNGDGVADEEKTLIKGIAFGFADRPADHTTNGLSLGIDGWLYIAGGDFGFMDAVGTDGKHLQHRGGGVIRFRPDGSGLEVFATGTRNILGTPISPLLDIFARDNTNDGGGWDVRFHHFTGLEDHGYPRLYKNFGDEHIQPLADYGGGSGCGSVYLSEPGFPKEWNDAPMTCDWGTGALWKHTVEPKGATFIESKPPEKFVAMTRPTDADVDGMGHLYVASWKGATFNWQGPDVGYIVRVTPKGNGGWASGPSTARGFQPSGAAGGELRAKSPQATDGPEAHPPGLLDGAKATDEQLIKQLESPSQVRVLDAQRELLRRKETQDTRPLLMTLAGDTTKALSARVAALFAITQRDRHNAHTHVSPRTAKGIAALAKDPLLQRFVIRAWGEAGDIADDIDGSSLHEPVEVLINGLKSNEPRTRLEAIIGAARKPLKDPPAMVASLLGDSDPVVAHTAFRALAMMNAHEACFAIVDNYDAPAAQRRGAFLALMRMHTPEVVKGLIDRLAKASGTKEREGIEGALCRLHFHEGEWKGDSWGTRPDTRGPYYQPETWSESEKIMAALKEALGKAPPDEAAFLVSEMNRNRIQSNDALGRILELAKKDSNLGPDAVAQLATADTIPASAIPVLIAVAKQSSRVAPQLDSKTPVAAQLGYSAATLAQCITAITKTDNAEGWLAALDALVSLDKAKGSGKEQEAGRSAFLSSPKLENVHQAMEAAAAKVGEPTAPWAEAALLNLAARTTGSPEAREMSLKALDAGWADAKRRVQIIRAAEKSKSHLLDAKISAAANDSDKDVAKVAKQAVNSLKLKAIAEDKTPKVGTLKMEDAIAQVLKTKGDKALGEALFTKMTCVACHTTSQNQPQKGPYLGNIAQTYKRPDLAANILDPNRTIAQGFASELVTLKDGTQQMGFITLEGAAEIKMRNIAAQEFTYKTSDIKTRTKLPTSMMPPGLMTNFSVFELASLLDYLEALAKK
ncbi:MAG: discoidin domain-containing protein [Verrucomicrobiaceae bacterium]|nr:discoidin domain-containing protein [Verrucomicrobiaceae bacterium]